MENAKQEDQMGLMHGKDGVAAVYRVTHNVVLVQVDPEVWKKVRLVVVTIIAVVVPVAVDRGGV